MTKTNPTSCHPEAPLKVLMVGAYARYSGYGSDLIDMTQALVDKGIDVYMQPINVQPPIPQTVADLLTKHLEAPFDLVINHTDPGTMRVSDEQRSAADVIVGWSMWEMCVDPETEIFTKRGWLGSDELVVGDETLGITEDGTSQWTSVEAVNMFERRNRKMQIMHTQGHSSATTANHRWLVRTDKGSWVWKESQELTSVDNIPRNAPRSDNPTVKTVTDAEVVLVAWSYTEGWLERKKSIRIGQNSVVNSRETENIRQALTDLYGAPVKRNNPNGGLTWSESLKPDGMVVFSISREASLTLLEYMPDKTPSHEFLLSLTQEQLELFIETSLLGDGAHTDRGYGMFYQNLGPRMDAFIFACTVAGYATTAPIISTSPHHSKVPLGHVRVLKHQKFTDPVGRGEVSTEEVETSVWCPTTGTGTWLARRNGKIFFTGNSTLGCLGGKSSFRKRIKNLDALFGYSEVSVDAFAGLAPKKLPMGILQGGYDPTRWRYMERDWHSRRFSFIMNGQLGPRKNPAVAIQAFAELKSEYPEEFEPAEFHLHNTLPSLPPLIEDSIPKLRIHYRTFDDAEMHEFYRSGHVLLAPSRGEGKNLPALEMLSTGGSVIYTDWGGHQQWGNGQYAYPLNYKLVSMGIPQYWDCEWAEADKDHLKQLMLHCFRNREEVRQKGLLGSKLIPQQCSWDRVMDDFFRRLPELVPGKGEVIKAKYDEAVAWQKERTSYGR